MRSATPTPEVLLEVALLRRRQRLVEQHALRAVRQHQFLDLVGLAAADEQRRIGRLALGRDAGDGNVVRGLGQQREFVERGIERGAAAEVDAHQDHARRLAVRGAAVLRAAASWEVSSVNAMPAGARTAPRGSDCDRRHSGASPAWKFTARPGTTVEMACL